MTLAPTVNKLQMLEELLADKILILDGAMGTMVQALKLDERAMRGERFAGHHKDLERCTTSSA